MPRLKLVKFKLESHVIQILEYPASFVLGLYIVHYVMLRHLPLEQTLGCPVIDAGILATLREQQHV